MLGALNAIHPELGFLAPLAQGLLGCYIGGRPNLEKAYGLMGGL